MVKAVEPDKIPITSTNQLASEFANLQLAFDKDETEHTWEQIDKALKRFHAVVRGGACKFVDEFVKSFRTKEIVTGIIRSMATERTRLSATTLDLLASITRLGPSFSPLLSLYLPPLLKLLCRTNKLYISRAQSTLSSILLHTHLIDILKFIVSEWKAESGKSTSFRIGASELLLAILTTVKNGEIEKDTAEKRIVELEWIIKTGATDREAKVRGEIKKSWEIYRSQWPERLSAFTGPMTPVIRRYLNVSGATATTQVSSRPIANERVVVPSLHRTVVTSIVTSNFNPKVDNSSKLSSKSAARDVGPSRPMQQNIVPLPIVASEVLKSSRSAPSHAVKRIVTDHSLEASTSAVASTSTTVLSSQYHASTADTAAAIISSRLTSQPVVVSSSRGAFKPSTTLSRSQRHSRSASGQPIETKKARRFVPPSIPTSDSVDTELNFPQPSLSRSTSSSLVIKKPIATLSTSTPGPFRPQPSSSRSTTTVGTKSKPPMAGRAISTGNLPIVLASAQRAPPLSRSVTSSTITVITEIVHTPMDSAPFSTSEDGKETLTIHPHEVPLPTDNEEEAEEAGTSNSGINASFDAHLDELVKKTTAPNQDMKDSIDSPSTDNCSNGLTRNLQGKGILDEMLLMEEEEPSAVASTSRTQEVPSRSEPEVEGVLSTDKVEENPQPSLTAPQVAIEWSEETETELQADQSEEEESIEGIPEGIDVELIAQSLGREEVKVAEKIEETTETEEVEQPQEFKELILESSSLNENSLSPSKNSSIITPYRAETIPLPPSPAPSTSTSLLSSPSNSILCSTPFPTRILSSTPSHTVEILTPSAFHTTSFLFSTPLKSNTLPTVRFPKVALAVNNVLIQSPITSAKIVDYYQQLDLNCDSSKQGEDSFDAREDEDEEEDEEEEIRGSQSFCVPLNDLSQFGDEEEMSDTRSETPESLVGKVFFEGDLLDEKLNSVVGEFDDTVIFDRSLRASRTRSRSRGTIVRAE